MEFMSKTEFRLQLRSEAENIKNFNWGEFIPVQEAKDKAPKQEGVILLLNSEKEIEFVSTSNDMKRRVDELLNKSNGRFDNVAFVQFSTEMDYLKRFANRYSLNHFKLAFDIGENNFENVLDDNDPRVLDRFKRLQELHIDTHKK